MQKMMNPTIPIMQLSASLSALPAIIAMSQAFNFMDLLHINIIGFDQALTHAFQSLSHLLIANAKHTSIPRLPVDTSLPPPPTHTEGLPL